MPSIQPSIATVEILSSLHSNKQIFALMKKPFKIMNMGNIICANDSQDWLLPRCPSIRPWSLTCTLHVQATLSCKFFKNENTVVILNVCYILCTKSSGPNFICFDTLVRHFVMILWHTFTSCLSYGYFSTFIVSCGFVLLILCWYLFYVSLCSSSHFVLHTEIFALGLGDFFCSSHWWHQTRPLIIY